MKRFIMIVIIGMLLGCGLVMLLNKMLEEPAEAQVITCDCPEGVSPGNAPACCKVTCDCTGDIADIANMPPCCREILVMPGIVSGVACMGPICETNDGLICLCYSGITPTFDCQEICGKRAEWIGKERVRAESMPSVDLNGNPLPKSVTPENHVAVANEINSACLGYTTADPCYLPYWHWIAAGGYIDYLSSQLKYYQNQENCIPEADVCEQARTINCRD